MKVCKAILRSIQYEGFLNNLRYNFFDLLVFQASWHSYKFVFVYKYEFIFGLNHGLCFYALLLLCESKFVVPSFVNNLSLFLLWIKSWVVLLCIVLVM